MVCRAAQGRLAAALPLFAFARALRELLALVGPHRHDHLELLHVGALGRSAGRAVLRAIRDIDRLSAGTVEVKEYSARLPRFAPYALGAVVLWTLAASLRLLAPQFRTFP